MQLWSGLYTDSVDMFRLEGYNCEICPRNWLLEVCANRTICNLPNESSHDMTGLQRGCKHVSRIRPFGWYWLCWNHKYRQYVYTFLGAVIAGLNHALHKQLSLGLEFWKCSMFSETRRRRPTEYCAVIYFTSIIWVLKHILLAAFQTIGMVNCYVNLFFRFFAGSSLIGAVIIPAHSRISISPTSTAPGTRMSVEGYLDLIKMYWSRQRHYKPLLNSSVSVIFNLFQTRRNQIHICKLGQHRSSLLLKMSVTPELPPSVFEFYSREEVRIGSASGLWKPVQQSVCWLISN